MGEAKTKTTFLLSFVEGIFRMAAPAANPIAEPTSFVNRGGFVLGRRRERVLVFVLYISGKSKVNLKGILWD